MEALTGRDRVGPDEEADSGRQGRSSPAKRRRVPSCQEVPSDRASGFGLLEVAIAMVIVVVGLVALLGALSSVLVMQVRLRESSLETARRWSDVERIRAGSGATEAGQKLVISPEMRPLREYVVGDSQGVEWRVWRDD